MRTLCDVCESAAAILFCAADEAALCRACDEKVHMCNKLASRHVRVGLAKPNDVPRCDICENAPAFFYCEVDGTSLCLQCDMIVHVGGKRTHSRYLLLRQKVEFPGDKPGPTEELAGKTLDPGENKREYSHSPKPMVEDNQQNCRSSPMMHNAAAKKDELLQMVRFGAEIVFSSKDSTITDEDIDRIIAKGEEAKAELDAKKKFTEDAIKFKMDDTADLYDFGAEFLTLHIGLEH